jgi:hypothetical protein
VKKHSPVWNSGVQKLSAKEGAIDTKGAIGCGSEKVMLLVKVVQFQRGM